jgi:sulfur relay (sulfurtransferase) DsrF/TusC family protein
MKVTVAGKVFDTETALGLWGTMGFEVNETLYLTDDGSYFMHIQDDKQEMIALLKPEEAKKILNEYDEMQSMVECSQDPGWFTNYN